MYGDKTEEIMCGYCYTINVKHFEWAMSLCFQHPRFPTEVNCETVPTVLTLVLKRGLEQLGIGL